MGGQAGLKGLPNRPAGLSKAPTAGSGDDKTLAEIIETRSAGGQAFHWVLHSRPLKFRTVRSAFKEASVARPSGWLDSTFMIAIQQRLDAMPWF